MQTRTHTFALIVAICSAAIGCSTKTPHYFTPSSGRPIEVAVRHFKTDLAAVQYDGPTDFGALIAENIAGAFQERGITAIAISRETPMPDSVRYEFDGDLLKIDPGSWNLRFWVGFGAGNATVSARGWLRDLQTEDVLIDETRHARSNTWQYEENILRRACSKVARSFAHLSVRSIPKSKPRPGERLPR